MRAEVQGKDNPARYWEGLCCYANGLHNLAKTNSQMISLLFFITVLISENQGVMYVKI